MVMRPFASTIPLEQALDVLDGAVVPISTREEVALQDADRRVVARTIVAERDVPPFNRSLMDGYAVRAGDTTGASTANPKVLRLVGAQFAGEIGRTTVGPGECSTIATGAPLPSGADAVVMVEHTGGCEAGSVAVLSAVSPGQHTGRQGSDLASGQVVVQEGTMLNAARLGALASLGRVSVEVFGKPRVFVASTGNELVMPGESLPPGHIYEINRFTLAPVIRAHGGDVVFGPTARDTVESVQEALRAARAQQAHLIVLSGGSSVGDRDLLIDAVQDGGDVLFHGVAIRPGKPTLLARYGQALLLGMPGNPTSCLSNAYVFLVPLLRRMSRLPRWQPVTTRLPLSRNVTNASGRHTFYTVRLEHGSAVPAFKGSGDITSLAHADGYIEIPPHVDSLPAGSEVLVTLF